MEDEVECAVEDLRKSEIRLVEVFDGKLLLDQLVRKRITGLNMLRYALEDAFLPDPVFEHLARKLDGVPLDRGSGEASEVGTRADVVHAVAKLVEEGNNIIMVNRRRLIRCRFVKVADHGRGGGQHTLAEVIALDHGEDGSVAVLVVSWMQVEVKVA